MPLLLHTTGHVKRSESDRCVVLCCVMSCCVVVSCGVLCCVMLICGVLWEFTNNLPFNFTLSLFSATHLLL